MLMKLSGKCSLVTLTAVPLYLQEALLGDSPSKIFLSNVRFPDLL
jgi:hypothetical protein